MALATETRAVALAGFSEAEREVLIDALIKVRANLSSRDVAGEKPANRHAPSRLATHHA
jgi:hypothetical protein